MVLTILETDYSKVRMLEKKCLNRAYGGGEIVYT